MPLSKREANVRLCFGEVGVDLELCVHAHGPEVELIMEASCSNNNPLVITSSLTYAWSFATVVPTMIVFLWSHFSDKLNRLSYADQCACPTSILLNLRVFPYDILRISWNRITSYAFFINCYFSPIPILLGSGLSSTENTDKWINSALRFNNLNNLCWLWVY